MLLMNNNAIARKIRALDRRLQRPMTAKRKRELNQDRDRLFRLFSRNVYEVARPKHVPDAEEPKIVTIAPPYCRAKHGDLKRARV